MTVLLDTSFLLAMTWSKDANHTAARFAMRDIVETRVIAAPVLPEIFYMVASRASYTAAVNLFDILRTRSFQIEDLTTSDMARMKEIMVQYRENKFDFVDVSILALAERLNIREIYTLDRRDFTTFRPVHCDYLTLLP